MLCMLFLGAGLCSAGTHYVYNGLDTVVNDTIFVAGTDTLTIRNCTLTVNSVIMAFQDGIIIFENDSLTLNCNLYAWGDARVDFRHCEINWNARYVYQYNMTLAGGASMTMDSVRLDIPVSAGMTVTDSASFTASGSVFSGVWTKSAEKNASMAWTDCVHAYEFLINDSASLSFTRCTEVLLWLFFPKGSTGEITMPGDTGWRFLDSFYLGPQSADLRNIPYEVRMDSVTALWGCIPQAGCSVTVSDSKLRVMGFTLMDSLADYRLSHFIHDRTFTLERLPFPDRSITLKNTYVRTFNVYTMLNARLSMDSSVVGEMIAYHDSRMDLKQVTVDGSGGFFGQEGASQVRAENCTFTCALKVQERCKLNMNFCFAPLTTTVLGHGSIRAANSLMDPDPDLKDSATFVSVNFVEPENFDTLKPVQPVTADVVNLCGPDGDTADLRAFLFSVSLSDTSSRLIMAERPIASGQIPVTDWDTDSLTNGWAYLFMPVVIAPGDTLTAMRIVFKDSGLSPVVLMPVWNPIEFSASPNPFSGSLLLRGASGTVTVHDLSGRVVRRLSANADAIRWDGRDEAGRQLASGWYLVRFETRTGRMDKPVLKIR